MSYDARLEIHDHITKVRRHLLNIAEELLERAHTHDASKFRPPEVEEYLDYEPVVETIPYGTPDNLAARVALRTPGETHHYKVSRHHPEHFQDGILGMTLVDLAEMLCDWKAASDTSGFGLVASIEANQERFGYGDELKRVLLNTAETL